MMIRKVEIVMRVMTFNLRADNLLDRRNRWKQRSTIVYELIRKYDCDIVGLQEVTNPMEEDLKNNIRGYHHIGVSRTNRFFMERNTVLIKRQYDVLHSKTFWLSKRPEKSGSGMWHALFPRICTRVIYKLNGQDKICVYNTHLDCLSPVARRYGLKVILSDIDTCLKREKMPCILTGDFNARPNSQVMKQFRREAYELNGLRAVQDIRPEIYKNTTMGGFKERDEGMHIDYIFVSQEFDILNAQIIRYNQNGKFPSDHYPIMAELRLK